MYTRVGEHIREVKKKESKTYTGKGTKVKLLGSFSSKKPFKAEKTCKKLTPTKKKALAKKGARKYKKKLLSLR